MHALSDRLALIFRIWVQVQVEGVAYQLEFYGTMFVRPEDYTPAAPKRSRKKVRRLLL